MSSDFTFFINMAGGEDEKQAKGNKVKLETFKKWNIDFGYEEEDGLVIKMWCKLCNRFIDKIARDERLRGKALSDLRRIAEGTNFISKHTACRHLSESKVSFLTFISWFICYAV